MEPLVFVRQAWPAFHSTIELTVLKSLHISGHMTMSQEEQTASSLKGMPVSSQKSPNITCEGKI